jgi:diguanylate cyclase (GGDEF)-like protein
VSNVTEKGYYRLDTGSDEQPDQQEKALAKLLFRASLFLLIAYTVLMTIRLIMAPMHSLGLLPIIGTYSVVLTTMLMSYYRIRVRLAGHLLSTSLIVLVIFRAYIAGGTDSPVLIIGILIPIAAVFILGRLAGMVYAACLSLAIIVFIVMRMQGYEFPDSQLHGKAMGAMQSVVVIFVMSVSTWVALIYARHNESLTESLLEQTRRDHLTGIPNRRAFDYALQREIRRAHRQHNPMTLFMVDLDHFKGFNDLYGHHEGDQALIKVARIIQSCLRRPGDMVARYGGEEFTVILPDTRLPQAMQLAETMRHAVMGLNLENRESPQGIVTITLGISELNPDGDIRAEDLIKQADEALYTGKEAGRNQVCVAGH